MKFQVLSHAGLLVEHNGVQLLSDPWLIGSTYWRSWWNYPPLSKELLDSLHPKYIYLTHIHWDHFQSASLKLFPLSTKIICPRGHFDRMKRDLNSIGFKDVIELRHGESFELAPEFSLTSYSFDLLCDSAVLFESPNVTLLNLNDCKIMGHSLQQILKSHKRPDFPFCSHSSANSRACYEVTDEPETLADDTQRYIERFYQFVSATKARYAVPFASNQCYLHKETFHFNESNRTPMMVKEYWDLHQIKSPELKVMVSGDAWSEEDGFQYTGKDWFTNHKQQLLDYQENKASTLESFYIKEDRARVTLGHMERFFKDFFHSVPFFLRWRFKNHPLVYVLYAGENKTAYKVDIYQQKISLLDITDVNDKDYPLQIHLSAYVMRHALGVNIMAHIGVGKRIRYRVTKKDKKYLELYKSLLDLHEYEILPIRNNFRIRSIENWLSRWRELLLYAELVIEKVLTGKLNISRHLVPPPAPVVKQAIDDDNSQQRAA
jgi:hypothetical protein